MAIKGYSTNSRTWASPLDAVYDHIQDTRWVEAYPSIEMQSVYSIAPADWAFIYSDNKNYYSYAVYKRSLKFFVFILTKLFHSIPLSTAIFYKHVPWHVTAKQIIKLVLWTFKGIEEFICLGSKISSTENDVNIRTRKAWTTIDRLLII